MTEIENQYEEICNEVTLPNKIDDEYVKNRIPNGNNGRDSHSSEYSFALCGKDVSKKDLSNLSNEYFAELSFDTNTKFSKEQIKKFDPYKLLEKSKSFGLGLELLHKAGIDGTGVKVAIIDSPFEHSHKQFENSDIHYDDSNLEESRKNMTEFHGLTVTSLLNNIVPKASIDFYAASYDGDMEKFDYTRKNILKKILNDGENIDVISMSSSLEMGRKNVYGASNKYVQLLKTIGCEFIDSPRYGMDFRYGNRKFSQDGNEILVPYKFPKIEITKEMWEEKLPQIIKIIDELKAEIDNCKNSNHKAKLMAQLEAYEALATSHENALRYWEQIRENNQKEKIIIPCGGRTFAQIDGKSGYKYCGTCSASWTIPQVSGLFAIARQMNTKITYEEFADICRETSNIDRDKNKIINPEGMVRKINDINREKSIENPNEYKEIYNKSSQLITNLDKVKNNICKDKKMDLKKDLLEKVENIPSNNEKSEESSNSKFDREVH